MTESKISAERLAQLQFEVSAIEPSRRISMSSADRMDLLSIFRELQSLRAAAKVRAIRGDGEWVAWRIVPAEPTDEMASAAIALDPKVDLDARYRAMIAVAPTPEVFGFVPLSVYEAAVKGRRDFRNAYRRAKGLTEGEVVQMLQTQFDNAGVSYDKFGDSVGLSGEFIRNVLNGTRAPSKAILRLVGVEKLRLYRLLDDDASTPIPATGEKE